LQQNLTHLKPAQDSATLKPGNQNAHRWRTDDSVHERIASALEALVAGQKTVSNHTQRPKLMSYEEAAEVTGLKRSKLESMCQNGRFREGRHYIKEGGRVLFHYNLPDLMFEDKFSPDKASNKNTDYEPSEGTPKKKPLNQPSQRGSRVNINYSQEG
jgi:hypothetical protein